MYLSCTSAASEQYHPGCAEVVQCSHGAQGRCLQCTGRLVQNVTRPQACRVDGISNQRLRFHCNSIVIGVELSGLAADKVSLLTLEITKISLQVKCILLYILPEQPNIDFCWIGFHNGEKVSVACQLTCFIFNNASKTPRSQFNQARFEDSKISKIRISRAVFWPELLCAKEFL